MSQFLSIQDLDFDNIMICFDNSSNELEYTTYNYSNQETISKMEDCFNDFVEELENDDDFEEIYASPNYRLFFNNQEEEKVLIKITDDEWISANVYIYIYILMKNTMVEFKKFHVINQSIHQDLTT